ncbi:MAG: methylated-DNA--[protein]-cysteine S-methyltransferase [Calditrichaeota bacterium]|nr:MAG: methylated-DNA--[protein]-cysteine S-methyltransferase [Calditrichota bacterium]
MPNLLPDEKTMYQALINKDRSFEGIFFVAVKTTGIFCRPGCTARTPKRENVEFYPSPKDALHRGYRPCKVCHPMGFSGETPPWLNPLLDELSDNIDQRISDSDLRRRGIEPNRIRRWFKKNHGMTFQAYLRALRISRSVGRIKYGEKVIEAAYDSGYESLSGFTDTFKKMTGFSPNKSGAKKIVNVARILTPLGPMVAGAVEEGICLFEFSDRGRLEKQFAKIKKYFQAELIPGEHKHFEKLKQQLNEYFAGKRIEFSVPLAFPGTEFQQKVWTELQNIKIGETRSYSEQAAALGQPEAVRAVARANGANRIAIIIPCHRVIGKNGKLVGYGGGLWRKKYLLQHEKKYGSIIT